MSYPLNYIRNKLLKRLIDIIISLVVIIFLLSWLLPILALLIKLTSKGSIFFIQQRSGLHNQSFNCIKLRSMHININKDTLQARDNDSRITLAGKLLRKFSLDELPQFFNVLGGDMSVIGPRPHMLKHTQDYSKIVNAYMNRLAVKPGITGLSQVMGYRGEIKNNQMIANRVRLDVFYIKNWSIKLEIWITLKTILLMLFGANK